MDQNFPSPPTVPRGTLPPVILALGTTTPSSTNVHYHEPRPSALKMLLLSKNQLDHLARQWAMTHGCIDPAM